MTAGAPASAYAGLAAGASALVIAAALLHRTLTVTLEIRRYADDIAQAGEEIAGNTDLTTELVRLGALSSAISAAAARELGSGKASP